MKTFYFAHNGLKMLYFVFTICILIVSPQRGRIRDSDTDSTRVPRRDRSQPLVDGVDLNQQQLTAARSKFSAINNQHYKYQFQKSCFCPICDIQPMNVIIKGNKATSLEYAEGNEYALTNFCFGNQQLFDSRMSEAEMSIDNIFDMIQTSIDNGDNVGVLYHVDIGIPLSISIDPLDAITDDETQFLAINCLEFDVNFPSPPASDNTDTQRGRGRNRRNREAITIEEFNADNPYSCQNVQGMYIIFVSVAHRLLWFIYVQLS